jgi:Glycosyl hydrolases family 43
VTLAVLLAAVLVGSAAWTDAAARTRARNESTALSAANARLATLRHDVAVTTYAKAVTTSKRDALEANIVSLLSQLAATNASLDAAHTLSAAADANIGTLHTCLGGVQSALSAITAKDTTQAAKDISAVSGPCTELAGGADHGLVYPFDFPDPDVIRVGNTYYAYATNSVEGNVQIIQSTDLTHWTAVGNALPGLPSWAAPRYTWAPAVSEIGGGFVLYYAADLRGKGVECISVATSVQPQGAFTDRSTAPLECQPSLGGSIDPASYVAANGTPYLLWKSGGPGSSKIWSQQLDPAGTAPAAGTSPTLLLVPDQRWQAGTVEAPDLVTAGGSDFLFFSGNDWDGAGYAVGVASCAGPLGPCADATPEPILSSGPGLAGPGGESVFADTSDAWWIAFDAWAPGAVGFPNSRCLYLRQIDLSGSVPVVAAPA